MGIDEKKAKNFLHYYKIHIVLGIVFLLVAAFTIRGCVTRIDPDFNMAFIGQISFNDTDVLKKAIQTGVTDIKEPGFDSAFLGGEGTVDGQQEYAMQMKAMVLFAAADVDLFILDSTNYKKFAAEGAFISLDDIAPKLGIDKEKSEPNILKIKGETAEHVYGIDISNSSVLKQSGIFGKDFIAAIPLRGKKIENAEKVIKFLLK